MSTFTKHIKSQYLLVFWLICLFIIFTYSPFAINHSNILIGMFIGYLQAKTKMLSLFSSNFGDWVVRSYLSLRYLYNIASTNHDGLKILTINLTYFGTFATFLYFLIRKVKGISLPKKIVFSFLVTGVLFIGIGVNALLSAPIKTIDKTHPYHLVRQGDTCEKIAFDYNVTVESLIKENNLSDNCDLSLKHLLAIPQSEP